MHLRCAELVLYVVLSDNFVRGDAPFLFFGAFICFSGFFVL